MGEREQRVRELVEFLCSRECLGRAPGTPGSAVARARIVRELEAAGVEPGGDPGGAQPWLQEVPDCGFNILGRIPGQGPLADRAVLVAAHYDHLGAAEGGEAYWGADDNAAAVAILMDVARELPRAALGRQVILAAFDGEEPPHFLSGTMGSMHYATKPTVPLDRIDTMVCMDLCGHALGSDGFPDAVRQTLFVLGAERSEGTPDLVDAVAAKAQGVVPRRLGLDVIPPMSDYYAFSEASVPVLFLTCGRWQHYHAVTDTPEKLDYPKIVASADFLRELTVALSTRPETPVVHTPDARDDAASLLTLVDLGGAISPLVPIVGPALAPVRAMLRRAEEGKSIPGASMLISMLVSHLEAVLGG